MKIDQFFPDSDNLNNPCDENRKYLESSKIIKSLSAELVEKENNRYEDIYMRIKPS